MEHLGLVLIEPILINFFVDNNLKVIQADIAYEYSLVRINGNVYSTGYAPKDGNGIGGSNTKSTKLQLIETLKNINIIQISTGYYYALFVSSDGNVYCWG